VQTQVTQPGVDVVAGDGLVIVRPALAFERGKPLFEVLVHARFRESPSNRSIQSLADIVAAHDGLWAAVNSGALSIDEGVALGTLLEKTESVWR
jgi:hypothetical protein